MERLFIPHLSVPGDDTTFRGNARQRFWHKVLFTFQIDEIDAPGGLPKTPVTCADWRIVPPSCSAARKEYNNRPSKLGLTAIGSGSGIKSARISSQSANFQSRPFLASLMRDKDLIVATIVARDMIYFWV